MEKEIRVPSEIGEKLLGFLKEMRESHNDDNEKIGEYKMTREQREVWAKFKQGLKNLKEDERKLRNLRRKFWNMVEGYLEIFDKDLRVNSEKNSIEVYEKEDECDCEDCS